MMFTRHRIRSQQGSALTEFVLVVPVLVALIYGAHYLTDLGVFKLKAQEIARYSAWSMAVRPLSDFDTLEHNDAIRRAQESALIELANLYADLDGGRDPQIAILASPGRSALTMGARYTEPTPSDLRVLPVRMLPGPLDGQWSSPLSLAGIVLNFLNIGSGTQDLFSGPYDDLGLNLRGEVHGRARVRIEPPFRPQAEAQRVAIKRYADLDEADPRGSLRDLTADGTRRDIKTVLIADPWRLHDGATAKPSRDRQSAYAGIVASVSENGIKALPGGPIINLLVNWLIVDLDDLPAGDFASVFDGTAPRIPRAVVFSRPLTARRDARPSVTATERFPGQVNIVEDTGAQSQYWESGAVMNHESQPLYVDDSGQSGYVEALNDRGPNFMGCPHPEERRCPDWR